MKTLLKTIVLALTLTVASTAFAQQAPSGSDTAGDGTDQTASPNSPVPFPFDTNEAEFERAKLLLSGYHGLPPKETFEETLDHPKLVVTAIALDKNAFSMHRKHALAALGYWADAGVLRIYTQLLQDDGLGEAIHHKLILLVAEHFPGEALGHLEPYLSHDDLQFRLTAIEAIRRIPGDKAVEALRVAKKSETNKVALERLEKYTRIVR
jgi:hypothetical protein